jgi:hypothetical protein
VSPLVRLGYVFALFATCLVALEATCRVDDYFRYGTPLFSPVVSPDGLVVRDATGAHGRPHARYTKFILNNLGMRGPDVPAAKPAGVVRVVTLGASETFGLYESLGHEYPRQLEDSLRSCASFEVINAALIGMSLPTQVEYLHARVAPLKPDLVVLYPTPVQYLNASMPAATRPDSSPDAGRRPWSDWMQLRVEVRLENRLNSLIPARVRNYFRRRSLDDSTRAWHFDGVPSDRLARYDADLRRLVAAVRAIGARPVLMTHANVFMGDGPSNRLLIEQWRLFYPHAAGTTLLQFDSAAAVVTRHVAADDSVPIVDLAAIVRDRLRPAGRYFGDYEHFSDLGAGMVASSLRPVVLDVAQVPCHHMTYEAQRP